MSALDCSEDEMKYWKGRAQRAERKLTRMRAALETVLEATQVDEDHNVTPEWNAAYVAARAALEGRG